MALAPVRAPVELVHDRLDGAEVRLPLHAAVHVHRDVAAVATRRRAQQRVVGRHRPHLDREGHREAAIGDQRHHAADGLDRALARQRVLHLGEAHEPRRREDRRGGVDPLGAAGEPRDEPVELRDPRRHPAPGAAQQLERVVGEQDVVGVRAQAAARARRLLGAVVRARERDVAVREDEELEVVVGERELLEALERLLERRGRIHAVERERRHAAQRHLGDRAQRAEPHAGGAEHVGVAVRARRRAWSRRRARATAREIWAEMLRRRAPVPWVAVEIAPAIVCASMSPRFSRARPWPASRRLSSRIVMPAWTRTSPEERSTSSTPRSRRMLSDIPSVQAMSLNECPLPVTRRRRPRRSASTTAAASSCGDAGSRITTGRQPSSPAQLRHRAAAVCRSLGSRIRWTSPSLPRARSLVPRAHARGRRPGPGARP